MIIMIITMTDHNVHEYDHNHYRGHSSLHLFFQLNCSTNKIPIWTHLRHLAIVESSLDDIKIIESILPYCPHMVSLDLSYNNFRELPKYEWDIDKNHFETRNYFHKEVNGMLTDENGSIHEEEKTSNSFYRSQYSNIPNLKYLKMEGNRIEDLSSLWKDDSGLYSVLHELNLYQNSLDSYEDIANIQFVKESLKSVKLLGNPFCQDSTMHKYCLETFCYLAYFITVEDGKTTLKPREFIELDGKRILLPEEKALIDAKYDVILDTVDLIRTRNSHGNPTKTPGKHGVFLNERKESVEEIQTIDNEQLTNLPIVQQKKQLLLTHILGNIYKLEGKNSKN